MLIQRKNRASPLLRLKPFNGAPTHPTTWTDAEDITRRENKSVAKRQIPCDSTSRRFLEQSDFRQKVEGRLPGLVEGKRGVSVLQDKEF